MPTRDETISKINDLIKKVQVAMLVTQAEDGTFRSRPMTTQEQEFDGDVWFFASSDSDVVNEVKNHPQVNVAYSDRGNYVSLSGTGAIVMDVAKKKELWNAELKVWFEGAEPESPKVALIKVDAQYAEYWDAPNGIIGNAVTAIKAALSRDEESAIDTGKATY